MPTECQDLVVYNLFLQEGGPQFSLKTLSQQNGLVNFAMRQICKLRADSLALSRIFSGPQEAKFFFNVFCEEETLVALI